MRRFVFTPTLFLLTLFLCLGTVTHAQTYVAPDQCIYALNHTANNALGVSGAAIVDASTCGVIVNSARTSSWDFRLNGTFNAKYFTVVGGYVAGNSVTYSPTPVTGSAEKPDPLTWLTPPMASSQCSYTNFSVTGGSATLSPGTYCNGITISGGANVTFTAGLYIMMGGGLKASSSAILNGTGVTFFLTQGLGYNYGPLSITGSSSIRLKAPTTDPYYGILFYQDPSIGAGKPGSTITGNADLTEGVFYFPTTSLSYSGNSEGNAGNYLILVADTITVTGSAYLKANYPSRSPLSPPIAVSVTPATGTLYDGQTQQFTATVSYSVNTSVTWTVSPAGAGTMNSAGLYTAPASITSQHAVTITATSQADTTKSATATIT